MPAHRVCATKSRGPCPTPGRMEVGYVRSTPVEFRLRGRLVRLSCTTNILEGLDFVARREASVIVAKGPFGTRATLGPARSFRTAGWPAETTLVALRPVS
jgi:hypothetical protein